MCGVGRRSAAAAIAEPESSTGCHGAMYFDIFLPYRIPRINKETNRLTLNRTDPPKTLPPKITNGYMA